MKNSGSFHISAQNIDCGYSLEPPHRGGSNEYPQSMFPSRNMKNKVYPCKPQFYYIKVGFNGGQNSKRRMLQILPRMLSVKRIISQARTLFCVFIQSGEVH